MCSNSFHLYIDTYLYLFVCIYLTFKKITINDRILANLLKCFN